MEIKNLWINKLIKINKSKMNSIYYQNKKQTKKTIKIWLINKIISKKDFMIFKMI